MSCLNSMVRDVSIGTTDPEALKDLAQQGASRAMKIKKMPKNYKTVNELTPSVRDSRMAGVFF